MTERVYPETGNRNELQRGRPKGAYYNMEEQKPAQPPFQLRPPPPQSARPRYLNNDYGGRPRRRRCTCCRCLAWTCFVLVLLIVLVGIAAVIFYFVVRPKAPHYDVQDVRLTSFSITPSASGAFQLSATTTYSVEARNPNKHIGIYFDTINVDVHSDGTSIGKGSVTPFFQGRSNTTFISGALESKNVPLVSTVGSALLAAEKSGNIPLAIFVDVRVRIKLGAIKTPHVWVHVRCNVNVNPGVSNRSQILSKKCSVKG